MVRKKEKEKEIKPADHEFDVKVENELANRIVTREYEVAKTNAKFGNADYQSYLDMLSCERSEKNYDWRSDVTTGEFTALHLIQQGLSATQHFSTRDFTEVYIGDASAIDAAKAAKKLINNTLNLPELNYYQKLMRLISAKDLDGACYVRCWWEQKTVIGIIGSETRMRESEELDINGNQLVDRATQIPGIEFFEEPVEGEIPVIDRFNFDVIDRRDIFASAEYTYSLQEKKWVIVRYNTTIGEMEDLQEEMGYINLNILKNLRIDGSDRGKGTHTTDNFNSQVGQESDAVPIKDWLIVERYGKDLVLIRKDEEGNVVGIEPGTDGAGRALQGAELVSVISAFAISGQHRVLVRFQQNPYRSATGESYIPLIRGLAYIHPSKDDGMGDGKCSRELQITIDDTVNVMQDGVMIDTMKVFVARKGAIEANDTVYMEPEHVITVEDPQNDIRELQTQTNMAGAQNMAQFFSQKMQQIQSVDPTSVSPVQTATAEARDEARTTTRNQYKQLSFTYTFETPFYWMMQQMHWQFASEQTLTQRIGEERVADFDPSLAYAYHPITSAVETEHGKNAKIRTLLQQMQITASIENPKTPAAVNMFNAQMLELQGVEFENIRKFMLDDKVGGGGGGSTPSISPSAPTQNEQGFEQSNLEQNTREVASGI